MRLTIITDILILSLQHKKQKPKNLTLPSIHHTMQVWGCTAQADNSCNQAIYHTISLSAKQKKT